MIEERQGTIESSENAPDVKSAEPISASEFAKAALRRNVVGKLKKGTTICGHKTGSIGEGIYFPHGPEIIEIPKLAPLASAVTELQEKVRQYLKGLSDPRIIPELASSHIISVASSLENPENTVLAIHFFQDRWTIGGAGHCTPAWVQIELSGHLMNQLLTQIQENPDLLEDFYQEVFPGLDRQGNSPGMRRVKADGFYLIQETELEKVQDVLKDHGWGNLKAIKDFLPCPFVQLCGALFFGRLESTIYTFLMKSGKAFCFLYPGRELNQGQSLLIAPFSRNH
jgi:hypothetical protein